MIVFVVVFCLLISLGFGLASAWSDFKGLTIPNIYSVAIVLAFAPAYAAVYFLAPEADYFSTLSNHVLAGAIVFGITFVLFALKFIGAGDSKLSAAFAVWTGTAGLFPFLFFMTVVGGVLGLATVILRKFKPFKNVQNEGWIAKAQTGENAVPYGIAIFLGAFMAFYQLDYFNVIKLVTLE